jgi:hypothetical protein
MKKEKKVKLKAKKIRDPYVLNQKQKVIESKKDVEKRKKAKDYEEDD